MEKFQKNKKSKVHQGDAILRDEGGLSVWRAVEVNNCYYPILPEEPNDNTISDYFDLLLSTNKKVYLVTGDELYIEGACREPLLINVTILKDISSLYRRE